MEGKKATPCGRVGIRPFNAISRRRALMHALMQNRAAVSGFFFFQVWRAFQDGVDCTAFFALKGRIPTLQLRVAFISSIGGLHSKRTMRATRSTYRKRAFLNRILILIRRPCMGTFSTLRCDVCAFRIRILIEIRKPCRERAQLYDLLLCFSPKDSH